MACRARSFLIASMLVLLLPLAHARTESFLICPLESKRCPREARQPSDPREHECKGPREPARRRPADAIEDGVERTLGYVERCGAEEERPVAAGRRWISGQTRETAMRAASPSSPMRATASRAPIRSASSPTW